MERLIMINIRNFGKVQGFVPITYVEDPAPKSRQEREGRVALIVAGPPRDSRVPLVVPGELLTHTNPISVPQASIGDINV